MLNRKFVYSGAFYGTVLHFLNLISIVSLCNLFTTMAVATVTPSFSP